MSQSGEEDKISPNQPALAAGDSEEQISEDLTAKLIQFHDVTNIEDLGRCKEILQRHSWDVEKAVQSTFMDEDASLMEDSTPVLPPELAADISAPSGTRRVQSAGPVRRPLIHSPNHTVMPRQMVYIAGRRRQRPEGIFDWAFLLLVYPFQCAYSQVFGVLKFVWRIFFPDPRERVTDPEGDVRTFITEFQQKFTNTPRLLPNTYKQAEQAAKTQLSFLLIYLHDPFNKDTEPFCNGSLCHPDSVDFINSNMMFWACSIEKPEGYRVQKMLRNPASPSLTVVCLYQSRMTVVARILGQVTSEELVVRLREVKSAYEPVLAAVRADRAALDMNKRIRQEQDEAYRRALQIDQQKMDRKKKEVEEQRREQEEKERLKSEKQRRREAHLLRKENCLREIPEEPKPDDPNSVAFQIKLPNGERLRRSFLLSDSVKVLHDFVYAQESCPAQFRIVTSFPRRPVPGCATCDIDPVASCSHPTLASVGLERSEALTVESTADDDSDDDSDCAQSDSDSNRADR